MAFGHKYYLLPSGFFVKTAILIITCLLLSSGCTPENNRIDNVDAGEYSNDFSSLINSSYEPIVKAVLEDGKITDDELLEIKSKYNACVHDAGVDVEVRDDGSQSVKSSNISSTQKVLSQCDDKYKYSEIRILRDNVRKNPQKIDLAILMSQCLVRHNLVPSDYTADDWKIDFFGTTDQKISDNSDDTPVEREDHSSGVLEKYIGESATPEDLQKYTDCQNNPLDLDNIE